MSDLLEKWLIHHDVAHRGWTRAGIAAGAVLLNGFGPARPKGGYNLYRGATLAGIDMTQPVGVASHDATTIMPWPWIAHLPGETYWYRLVGVGPGGVESVENADDPQVVSITVGDDGTVPDAVPPAPRDLVVVAISAGRFRLRWVYVPSSARERVHDFRVYGNGGAGEVDYETPVATVTARRSLQGRGFYAYDSDAFADGTAVTWAVRSASAAGNEEQNTTEVEATADAEAPADHQVLEVAYGEDE